MSVEELKALAEEQAALELKIKEVEQNRLEAIERITGVDRARVLLVGTDRIVFTVETLEEASKVLNSYEPFRNSWEIKHTRCKYLAPSLYRIDVRNNYYEHKCTLSIRQEQADGTRIQVEIPSRLVCSNEDSSLNFLYRTSRHLYDSESVYVEYASRREFLEIKVNSYNPYGNFVSWYGGDKTLTCEGYVSEIVEAIKSIAK